MANSNLEGPVTQANLVAKANAMQDALSGGLYPRSVAGQPVASDGSMAPDIGSATNNWDAIYCRRIIAGGVELDLSALSHGTTIGIITESDATYDWTFNATKALFIIVSGASGAGGGGSGANMSYNRGVGGNTITFHNFGLSLSDKTRAEGSAGAAGNPTSLTHTRTGKTYKTLAPAGGLGGDAVPGKGAGSNTILINDVRTGTDAEKAAASARLLNDEENFTDRDMITLKRNTHDASNTDGGMGGIRGAGAANMYPPSYDQDDPIIQTSLIGGRGWPGGVSVARTIIDDIRDNDQFNIALGAGGLGGAGAPLNTGGRAGNYPPRGGAQGKTGDTGYVIIIPINETTT